MTDNNTQPTYLHNDMLFMKFLYEEKIQDARGDLNTNICITINKMLAKASLGFSVKNNVNKK